MARKRLPHVPDWLTVGEIRLVLEAFYGAFDSDTAQSVFVSSPWDARKYPPRVTVAELCAWLEEELQRVHHSCKSGEAKRQGPYGSGAHQQNRVA
jgi:hypothetical protein